MNNLLNICKPWWFSWTLGPLCASDRFSMRRGGVVAVAVSVGPGATNISTDTIVPRSTLTRAGTFYYQYVTVLHCFSKTTKIYGITRRKYVWNLIVFNKRWSISTHNEKASIKRVSESYLNLLKTWIKYKLPFKETNINIIVQQFNYKKEKAKEAQSKEVLSF